MLAREQGCRRNHRDLLPAHRRHERRPQRHLGLAKANVAADQPVHRAASGQIGQHIVNRRVLIVGFLPREFLDELIVAGLLGLKHRGGAQRAQRRCLEQFVSNRADPLFQAALAFLPAFTAQPVKRGKLVVAAIAAERVEVLHRHVQFVAASILQHHAIMRALPHRDRLQAAIAPDPVFQMHHQIARGQRGQLSQEGIRALAAFFAADQPVAQNILLGNQFNLGV